jgi:hypothetical protein
LSVEQFSVLAIWAASLAIPFLLFVVWNPFRSISRILARAIVAVAVGWALAVAYVVASQAIFVTTASQAELLLFYGRDGAPRAFAESFGWVPAFVIVAVTWASHVVAARWRARRVGL